MALELKIYSLKFSVARACIDSKHTVAKSGTDPDPPRPATQPARDAELEILFTLHHHVHDSVEHIVVSLDSLWDIVCGAGRDNRRHKFNNQVKRLLATAFGTETAAQCEIDAWQDHKYVPVHIALACLWGRASMACHSHGLALDDHDSLDLKQLVFVTAHFDHVREQVLAQAGANAHSTVRSDALVAPPPAVASESDADADADQLEGGDQDGDQDDDHAHCIDVDDNNCMRNKSKCTRTRAYL